MHVIPLSMELRNNNRKVTDPLKQLSTQMHAKENQHKMSVLMDANPSHWNAWVISHCNCRAKIRIGALEKL
jgi:hypothetical protein